MAGSRHLPPHHKRSKSQHVEAGLRLDELQRQIHRLWDKQIILLKLKGCAPPEISEVMGCSERHVRARLPSLMEAEARKLLEASGVELVTQLDRLNALLSEAWQQYEERL